MKLREFIAILGFATAVTGCVSKIPGPAASVSFIEPVDGAVVTSPFKIKFAVTGMAVTFSGDMTPNTGHHHLLVDRESVQEGTSIGYLDYQKMHFNRGQTETQLSLPPGPYKLTMQFANSVHVSYGVSMSRTINITVK